MMYEREPHRLHRYPRLGSVEAAVLEQLMCAGGLMPRRHLLTAAFPDYARAAQGPDQMPPRRHGMQRALAESKLSRAVSSLERKGLIRRERQAKTGIVVVRALTRTRLPIWERDARADDDAETYCRQMATQWAALAQRFGSRAASIRAARTATGFDVDRRSDLAEIKRLQSPQRRRAA